MKHAILAAIAMAIIGSASAQEYPSKPIRMIIPSTPGGGTDFIGRLMSSKLAELNGWNIVPENRPGAGTALGLAEAAHAQGKGYDLVVGQSDNVTLIPLLMKVSYDPVKDLVPVALVGTTPIVLLVSAKAPWKTLPQFIQSAKEKPGSISYGTSGTGGSIHMTMELLQQTAGFQMQHIPYKGSPPALTDLVGERLQFSGASISGGAGLIKSGKLRPLAVTSVKRNPSLPDVPSVSELGYKGFDMTIYYGIFAPANTPAPIVERLNRDFNRILASPDVRDALQAQGFAVDPLSPQAFARLVADDIRKNRQIIDQAHIKVE